MLSTAVADGVNRNVSSAASAPTAIQEPDVTVPQSICIPLSRRSLYAFTAFSGSAWSSPASRISTLYPLNPPLALISSAATCAAWYTPRPYCALSPVIGPITPILKVSSSAANADTGIIVAVIATAAVKLSAFFHVFIIKLLL